MAGELLQHGGRTLEDRRAREATRFVRIWQTFDLGARQGRIGGDDAVHAVLAQEVGDRLDLLVLKVRRDLEHQRDILAVLVGEPRLFGFQLAEQRVQRVVLLQFAQVLGVRAGNVDRHVARGVINPVEADQVVIDGFLDRRVEVLADINAEDAAGLGELRLCDVGQQLVDAVVVEAHAVDDRLLLRDAEHAWLGVARLRARCHRADLDEAEAEARQRVDVLTVLVESCGEADRIGEGEPHQFDRVGCDGFGQQTGDAGAIEELDAVHAEPVGQFRVEREEEFADQWIEHRRILPQPLPLRTKASRRV